MNIARKRKRLNRINASAYAEKLGDIIPIAYTAKLKASDIKSGVATVDIGEKFNTVCSFRMTAPDGTVRTVTKLTHENGVVKITSSDAAANDTVVLVIV